MLASTCQRDGLRMATFSSDLVFDGVKRSPYVESDLPNPLNVYGQSKFASELSVLAACPDALIVRTSAFFGPWDDFNFLTVALRELEAGRTFRAPADSFVSPTYVPDLVSHTLDLLIDGESGIWHLANEGTVSWYDFAKLGAEMAGVDTEFLVASKTSEMTLPAARPLYSVLSSEKAWVMPTLLNALERYASSRSAAGRLLRAA